MRSLLGRLLLLGSLVACSSEKPPAGPPDAAPPGPPDAGPIGPVRGGRVVYALEAETPGGYCVPDAQLAISGISVARAIYDTLTVPDEDGAYRPYLARSLTANADQTVWTIELREGILFHDGSALDATVVKNNLDAARGAYVAANGTTHPALLLRFVYANISSVAVSDPMTVTVTAKTPWPALPAFLFLNGRLGIMAQAQLDDASHCADRPIGTGPFVFEEWVVDDHLTVTRNPSYWQTDAQGTQLPYLDEIEFRPIAEPAARLDALESGAAQVVLTDDSESIVRLRQLRDGASANLVESDGFNEVSYLLLNSSKPPFDDKLAREAVALAFDRATFNQTIHQGILTDASGPFAPGTPGYLADTGFPGFDLAAAMGKVAEYEGKTGGPLALDLVATDDARTTARAELAKQMLEAAGMTVTVRTYPVENLINQVLGGGFNMIFWRNHPGGDPDTQYIWWHSGSLANFGRINDPTLDQLLDDARVETDPAARTRLYEDVNRRFASELWNIWGQYVIWAVGTSPDVLGVEGPPLPDGGRPWRAFVAGTPMHGISLRPSN